MPSKRDEPRAFRAFGSAAIRAEESTDGKPKMATFSGVAYTGATMRPGGWWNDIIVDLDGVRVPSQNRPVLRQHDHEKIVGHTESVKVDAKGIAIAGVFSNQESAHAQEVVRLGRNGFAWQLSIGANPVRTEFLEAGEKTTVNGREVTGPLTISRETELGEISFVPLGADGDTSATVSASKGGSTVTTKMMLKAMKQHGSVKAAKYSDDDIEKMSDDEAKAALKECMADDGGKKDDEDEKAKAKAAEDEEKKTEASKGKDLVAQFRAEMAAAFETERKTQVAEIRRVNDIKARCQKYEGINRVSIDGKEVDLIPHAIEKGWSPDQAELHALRAARPSFGPHLHLPTDPVVNEAVLEAAVFDALPNFKLFDSDFYRTGDHGQRRVSEREEKRITASLSARYTDQVRQAAHTRFKGRIGLQQFLTTLAAANGYRGPQTFNDPDGWGAVANHLAAPGIRADGPSTINTPATLANVQNKFMLQGYLFTEQAFMEFCSVLPVKDLKPTKSVQLFGDFVFKELAPSGEMQHATIGDNPYANQAKLQARLINIPLEYLINDDLGMFGQVPMMLGRGWGLRVNDLVYTPLNNPGNDDGGSTAFFAATHTIAGQSGNANYHSGAGSALSSSSLQISKQLFDKQVDPAGKPLGVDAEILLYPPELDVAAMELMKAQFIVMGGLAATNAASKQPNTNIWAGRYRPVMSRYLSDSRFTGYSTTAWYLLANPAVIPVVQIAALNGQMTPTIQQAGQDWQFNMLGITMRGWGGVGVSMQNFRGAVKAAGA